MDLLVSASLIAAFLAGIAALFAPCCITVLLPTYFASIFKEKSKVFFMTFVFFLGLLAVFIPIGLGFTALTQLFREFHTAIFLGGGIFLLILGIALTIGYKFSLPMPVHPELKKHDVFGVFGLGVFSAIATTCCAPVLAGVLALSALPGSYFLGAIYTLTYVLGMVTPLFILAALLDKANFTQKLFALRRPITFKVFGLRITNTVANLFSGLMFLGIGVLIVYLSMTDQLTMQNSYQLSTNLFIANVTKKIGQYTQFLPEPVWAFIFLSIFALIIGIAIKQLITNKSNQKGGERS
ncbi:MAG: cytochrome c biogenesis CcdA family protein [Patescibacteria group bacterium]|nr:cytochrome c biogenesis CcdA family protein [Patescibacteria group bacterium]